MGAEQVRFGYLGVCSKNPYENQKSSMYGMLWILSIKYRLDLKETACPHPPLVFDGPVKRAITTRIFLKDRFRLIRRVINAVSLKAWRLF